MNREKEISTNETIILPSTIGKLPSVTRKSSTSSIRRSTSLTQSSSNGRIIRSIN